MKLKLLTFDQFAKSLGIERQSIYKAVKNGRMPFVDDNGKKKIDINDRQVLDYIKSQEERTGQSFNTEIPEKPKTRQSSKTKKEPKQDSGQSLPPIEDQIPDELIQAIDNDTLTKGQAARLPKVLLEKLKIYESTKSTKIKAQQLKGKLIDRELVKKVFGVIHEIDISQVIASKSKIASAMAALFECDDNNKITEAEEKINDILYKVLKSEEIEIEKFLKKLK